MDDYDELLSEIETVFAVTRQPILEQSAAAIRDLTAKLEVANADFVTFRNAKNRAEEQADHLRQTLEALKPRPIEDAPRDNDEPLLCFGGGLDDAPDICRYHEKVGAWSCSFYTLDDTDTEPEGYNRPTHFIPLSALTALEK
jgi:hypothetical protein